MIAKAAGPITMRWQSTWPAKDIFHEFAVDFAKKVKDMTGGELNIEVLPAGAVVPAFGLLEAVSKGTLDGGHGVMVYHYGKQTALALWGSGPAYGMDANMLLAWHKYGGGKELLLCRSSDGGPPGGPGAERSYSRRGRFSLAAGLHPDRRRPSRMRRPAAASTLPPLPSCAANAWSAFASAGVRLTTMDTVPCPASARAKRCSSSSPATRSGVSPPG